MLQGRIGVDAIGTLEEAECVIRAVRGQGSFGIPHDRRRAGLTRVAHIRGAGSLRQGVQRRQERDEQEDESAGTATTHT